MTDFSFGDNIIDSRHIIARLEELEDEYDALKDSLRDIVEDGSHTQEEIDDLKSDIDGFETDYGDELKLLNEVCKAGNNYSDWDYGETLIHEDYFTQYTEELIEETCEMPDEFNSSTWPFKHMKIDYDEAADELKQDYGTIEADGNTYYIRA